MSECTKTGCHYLQTHCVTCGRLVIEKTLPAPVEWVKCEDRLPEHDNYVLGFEDGEVGIFFYRKCRNKWFDPEWIDRVVTHWRELPKGPED